MSRCPARRNGVAATLLMAAVLLLAGCGGGSSNGTDSEAGDEFAQAANAACAGADRRLAEMAVPGEEKALVGYLEGTERVIEGLHREIDALGGSGRAIDAYEAGLARSATILNEMANAARSQNPDAVRELSNGLSEIHLGRLAKTAQLESCAEAPALES